MAHTAPASAQNIRIWSITATKLRSAGLSISAGLRARPEPSADHPS
jgi:hypothetical protein